MADTYTYTNKTTSVAFAWPSTVTGVERIALSAQGELQRILRPVPPDHLPSKKYNSHSPRLSSAYFARPISVTVVYTDTFWHPTPGARKELPLPPPAAAIAQASEETPIIQTRQVHLVCSGQIVCTATATVRITDPSIAHLFLVENYAIGQMFRQIEQLPKFELKNVDIGPYPCNDDPDVSSWCPASNPDSGSQELWRQYRLFAPDLECDIVEVFPDRGMFVAGVDWLDGMSGVPVHLYERLDQYPKRVGLSA
ncbi:hypothetical protein P691DRAFT_723384 [Macrolepiota fuliginosa MF-IS2]|uniref:Uncharacterized protein n=1 Tax=Macrolepiota fuliginosa MF-IS2 TaxID=1400762 RepID=A0A9P5XLB4_9AGAR|nr:hypothetical protein P691DRAFT_723384 [Macrolepiota fuliginosa MF-IS2]